MRFFERLNTPWAVVIALVVFLAIDGFLLYRYQLTMQAGATAPPATTEQSSAVSLAVSSNEESSSTAEEPKKEDPTTTEETSTAPPAAQEEEEADLLRAVVGVEELPAWLMVQVDGQTVLEEVSQPGFSSEFEADQEISIWTGNGGAVRVEVNGQDLGFLGASGEVTALELARGSAPGLT